MRLQPVVMAHKNRADLATELVSQLGGAEQCNMALDVLPASSDPGQRWENGKLAWSMARLDVTADYGLVVQDDAVLAPDFLAGAEKALEHAPAGVPVSFYLGAGRPLTFELEHHLAVADQGGWSWAVLPWLYWGVAFAVPRKLIRPMVEYGDRRKGVPYDMRCGEFFGRIVKTKVWYTVPSTADHRDGPSLVGHNLPGRRACRFATGSALDVDWSRAPVRW